MADTPSPAASRPAAAALAWAIEPFPAPVRPLDELHLASLESLRERGQVVLLAGYDDRMLASARSLGISLCAE